MAGGCPSWRAEGDLLLPSGTILASSRLLLGTSSDDDLCSLPSFLAQVEEEEGAPPPPEPQAAAASLFQTGTGKSVQVSGAAMKRALSLFGSGQVEQVEKRMRSSSLFQTATGKSVAVKAAALDKARALLQEAPLPHKPQWKRSVAPFKHPRRLRFVPPLVARQPENLVAEERNNQEEEEEQINIATLRLDVVPRVAKFAMPARPSLGEYFHDVLGSEQPSTSDGQLAGALQLRDRLLEAGAKPHLATVDWVDNHYRWIVWKLSSQQRRFSSSLRRSFLTSDCAYLELKYRYVKEILFGQRSAMRRICEKDSPPSVTMVLCVSAIYQSSKVQLTDGWYALNAILDAPLSSHVQAGKIFVGQKLLVSGAELAGADEALPPLEAAPIVSLVLHANGTYRTHWASRLGIRKRCPLPLALKCVKQDGGLVPSTCLVVSRVYPLLYMERLADGRSVARSERAEQAARESFDDRRAALAESTAVESESDDSSSEGARLLRMLETSDEPEVIMADMSLEQHASVIAYQAQRKACVEKSIHQALEDAGLVSRTVTPFLKVRAAGLQAGPSSSEALVTIWAPDEQLLDVLSEGSIYRVSFLKPQSTRASQLLHLSTTKTSRWKRLTEAQCEAFCVSYNPRTATPLSSLEDVPAYSEFDAAVVILHVGLVKERSSQWVFVADGTCRSGKPELLAIEFSSVSSKLDTKLRGSVVGFCNLVKRQPDERNCVWIAGASDLTAYSTRTNCRPFSHLSKAAALATRWLKSSPHVLLRLDELVESLIGTS